MRLCTAYFIYGNCKKSFSMKINFKNLRVLKNRNWFDESIKDQSIDELNGLLKLLKVPEKVTRFCKTEYTTLGGGERRCDLVCATENQHKLQIEASYKKPEYYDVVRQIEYGILVYINDWREDPYNPKWKDKENYTPLEQIFITATNTPEKEIKVNFQKEIQNKSKIYTFENINYNEYIKRIKNKIKNNEEIDYDEIAFLKFIILTKNDKKTHEIMKIAIDLINQDQKIDEKIKVKIEMIYWRNIQLYIKEEYQEPLLEELTMESTMINQLTEEIKNEIKKEVIKEGREEERNRIKKILELENIPKETINRIINKSKENQI